MQLFYQRISKKFKANLSCFSQVKDFQKKNAICIIKVAYFKS